jgi:hypothetical protein
MLFDFVLLFLHISFRFILPCNFTLIALLDHFSSPQHVIDVSQSFSISAQESIILLPLSNQISFDSFDLLRDLLLSELNNLNMSNHI